MDARNKITAAFGGENLEEIFAKVEIFLATFPGDENITEASVKLVACILKAVEGAIVYFLSHTGEAHHTCYICIILRVIPAVSRIAGTLGRGRDFQKPLLASIEEIQAKCQKLIEEAKTSDIAGTREAMHLILEGGSSSQPQSY